MASIYILDLNGVRCTVGTICNVRAKVTSISSSSAAGKPGGSADTAVLALENNSNTGEQAASFTIAVSQAQPSSPNRGVPNTSNPNETGFNAPLNPWTVGDTVQVRVQITSITTSGSTAAGAGDSVTVSTVQQNPGDLAASFNCSPVQLKHQTSNSQQKGN